MITHSYWKRDPVERPTFANLVLQTSELLQDVNTTAIMLIVTNIVTYFLKMLSLSGLFNVNAVNMSNLKYF